MSSQRVVVLTDKLIGRLDVAINHLAATRYETGKQAGERVLAAEGELERLRSALLEHPEGITDDMVDRSLEVVRPALTLGCTCAWNEDGNPPANCTCAERAKELAKQERRRILEAALFPGDGEQ